MMRVIFHVFPSLHCQYLCAKLKKKSKMVSFRLCVDLTWNDPVVTMFQKILTLGRLLSPLIKVSHDLKNG